MAWLGLAQASMILTIIGQCFWLTGLMYLARGIFAENRVALIGVAMVVAIPGGGLLEYGEQFLTPRLFAEAVTLWALGSMLRRRPVRALLLLGLSATIHPLMTLPGLAVLFVHEGAARRVWWLIGALGVILSLGLGLLGIQPFARLFATFDPEWFAVVKVRDYFCLATQWGIGEWLSWCEPVALSALLLVVADRGERRLLAAMLVVAFGGLGMTLVGDYSRNVLFVDIQQYRAVWLLAVVTYLLVVPLLPRMRASPRFQLTAALVPIAIGLLIVTRYMEGGYIVADPVMIFTATVAMWEFAQRKPLPAVVRVLALTIVGLVCVVALAVQYEYMVRLEVWSSMFWQKARGLGLCVAALVALVTVLIIPAERRLALIGPLFLFATGLTVAAVISWDQRTQWTKFVETTDDPPKSLSTLLSGSGTVYWEGDVRVPWFVLRRSSYFSCAQGTGALFFRGTAVDYQHRYDSFLRLGTMDFEQRLPCPSQVAPRSGTFDREELEFVCRNEPELDWLVLTRPVANSQATMWRSPAAFEIFQVDLGKTRV